MIFAVFQGTEMTPDRYERVVVDLAEAGYATPGGLVQHFSGWTDHGFCIVDVWEDVDDLVEFAKILFPILEHNGLPPMVPQIYPVHDAYRMAVHVAVA